MHFLAKGGGKKQVAICNHAVKFDHSAGSPTLLTPQSMSAQHGVGLDRKGKMQRLCF